MVDEKETFFKHTWYDYDSKTTDHRGERHTLIKFWNIILILMLPWFIISTTICIHSYLVILPAKGWYDRIPQASTAEQLAEYCSNTLSEMDRLGIAEGHYALVFKNSNNDISVDKTILAKLRDKALFLSKTYDKGSMDYAESMADMRKQFEGIQTWFWYWCLVNRVPFSLLAIPWFYMPIVIGYPMAWAMVKI